MTWRGIASLVVVSLLSSCGGERVPTAGHVVPEKPAGSAAPRPELRLGVLPERNIFRQLQRYEPVAAYLSARTGVTIRLSVLPRYGNIVRSFTTSGLDGAFFGSFTYALAHRRLGVEVLARPQMLNGSSTYFGVILVRRDSGIRDVHGLKGKRFAFVDQATTAGYLLPLGYFAHAGIKDYRTFLGEAYFAGTHEDVIRDVLDGKADAGAAKSSVLERMAGEDPRVMSDLTFLDRSPDVPENALALSPAVAPGVRERIRHVMLTMHEDPQGREALAQLGAIRFILTRDEDYAPVYRYAAEVGLDLGTYEYDNSR
jgi:phosphonate transport system substrate-binding protein